MSTSAYTLLTRSFNRGCVAHGLLADGDRIVVGLSGGKDSMMLVRLLGDRARIFRPRIEVEAVHVVMDNVPYAADGAYLERFCSEAGMPLTVLHTSFELEGEEAEKGVDKSLGEKSESFGRKKSPHKKPACFLCSWNRRKTLFEYAKSNGMNKIALGHHQDDLLVTTLMNMTFEGSFASMPPLLQLSHYPLSIIRPLCQTRESLIAQAAAEFGIPPLPRRCPYENSTRRAQMTALLAQLEEINPEARQSLWRAMNRKAIN